MSAVSEAYLPNPGPARSRSTVIWDELARAWARTTAEQAAKRRQHARKASRAAIRLPMS